ncbi:hypothetical protein TVAG_281870 [Trichomonas vaginalis G3]|uniref:Uncharacterized protein n=1 Tax=Trichomonas vaginalis (strain ATCC PRA-98 / G3) TaxID=412133 RepID=A2E9Q2_TRIV3|nr:hypothetical protein TVAGG3_0043200 [Trichomonas vaginalis G3]EAY10587.1 hypothetical protein TVAG_281870 [Trichomonas vaginalis G3]KAI5540839.1 hypothetical protein TVAGG3_0043200 [Trichomonas vaginalis G3]|eukprot:XP_001322810.1 hypothetical protein [Trichomonas vaginalis G3]
MKDFNGFSPIFAASSEGYLEIVRHLSECECNKNDKNKNGSSSLHLATIEGHYLVVEYLGLIGANLNAEDKKGKTPLDYAKERRNENAQYKKIFYFLSKLGAKYSNQLF